MVFPVKVPYTVSADIAKYAGEVLNPHPDPYYLAAKRLELAERGDDLCAAIPESVDAVRRLSGYCGFVDPFSNGVVSPREALMILALQLEEDVALMLDGRLAAICFCFPSGFVPAKNLGLDFFHIHQPVADGDALRRSGPKVSALIAREEALFRRYVWTISALGSLSQHPALARARPKGIEDLYFRTETQTTVGMGNSLSLFFVKLEMQPLVEVWDDKDKRSQIIASIDSMSEAVLQYKNLQDIQVLLHQFA